jgi:TRAP-type mannitol/chloroaromatic compound transport system substrate-binding protein
MKKLLTTTAVCTALIAGAAQAQETWDLQSTYPGSLKQLGTLGIRIAEQITKITDGQITVKFQEPGAIVPALEVFDAVGTGAVAAGWSTPGYWAGRVPALQLLAAVPFGPQAGEYLAWVKVRRRHRADGRAVRTPQHQVAALRCDRAGSGRLVPCTRSTSPRTCKV